MFLALREIKHQPTRFALIIAVITLVAYLTFFLAALADGLAFSFRAAVDNWDAKNVILTDTSNRNIQASRMTPDMVSDAEKVAGGKDHSASIVLVPIVLERQEDGKVTQKSDSYILGLEPGAFISPKVTEGREPTDEKNEVIVNDSLKEDGWKLNDTVYLSGCKHPFTIVGFTHNNTFQTLPVLYIDQETLLDEAPKELSLTTNAVVTKSELSPSDIDALSDKNLDTLTTKKFIETLPGYSAQVLTFSMMIGALIIIASFVLSIFLYVLTLQKRAVLGILKARGVPTSYLVRSGAAQSIVLSAIGVGLGALLTFLTSFVLPAKMPFMINFGNDVLIALAFIFFSIIGGLMSVRVVTRIDPVEAIS
ncbi:ABC transporter permease [Actinomyces vulturis]|uniref:ABC transporter permease n=1 Tax=Actinomyces vulturis TaxID=1857645 RepID=UPI0008317446|nr:ABC transporter permease [Actinomyces vulturis]